MSGNYRIQEQFKKKKKRKKKNSLSTVNVTGHTRGQFGMVTKTEQAFTTKILKTVV